jgi:hypothetical protein
MPSNQTATVSFEMRIRRMDRIGHRVERRRLTVLAPRGHSLTVAIVTALGITPALTEMQTLAEDTRFCQSWAEAHERTLASLNKGRPPYPVKWKGCILLKRGASVDIIDHSEEWTEILFRGKDWFADE